MLFRFCRVLAVVLAITGSPFVAQSVFADSAVSDMAETVSVRDFESLLASKKPVFVLDVRAQEEYDEGHIKNATLIPLNVLPERLAGLPKDKKIVVYCRSGKRSAKAVAYLRAEGYKNTTSLSGGINAWAERNLAVAKSPNMGLDGAPRKIECCAR